MVDAVHFIGFIILHFVFIKYWFHTLFLLCPGGGSRGWLPPGAVPPAQFLTALIVAQPWEKWGKDGKIPTYPSCGDAYLFPEVGRGRNIDFSIEKCYYDLVQLFNNSRAGRI